FAHSTEITNQMPKVRFDPKRKSVPSHPRGGHKCQHSRSHDLTPWSYGLNGQAPIPAIGVPAAWPLAAHYFSSLT
ncbi:MAG TPA: hypothetical protein VMU69_29430, partial [Bradyrhizobium sp.]|nr:hypothetical protein [Bradyrhizobium sp.]